MDQADKMRRAEAQGFLSDEEFREFLDAVALGMERYCSMNSTCVVPPSLHLLGLGDDGGERPHVLMLLPDFDMDRRRELLTAMGKVLGDQRHHVVAAAFVSEAWMARDLSREEVETIRSLEDRTDRTEAVAVQATTFDARVGAVFWAVNRDVEDRISLGPRESFSVGRTPLVEAFWRGYLPAIAAHQDDPQGTD